MPTEPTRAAETQRPGFVLAVNGGSSSLKVALFRQQDAGDDPHRLATGKIERIGSPGTTLVVTDHATGERTEHPVEASGLDQAAGPVLTWVADRVGLDQLRAVGHRVVHGGPIDEPRRVDPDLLRSLREFAALDPDHVPGELALIEAFSRRLPDLSQVVCFDTTFHRGLPRVARIVPIPRRFEALGVRRYGFHGLSYEYLREELGRQAGPDAARGRVILAHLGSGASLAAMHGGRCVDTTMGFTPASGLVMGTRPGDLDPGLAPFLAQRVGMSPEAFGRMVNHESGLRGVSETSGDVRDLLAAEPTDPRAAEAVALFVARIRAAIGALTATLGGLDTLVFSGGIGERSAEIRRRIGADFGYLGLTLDPDRNQRNASVISEDASRVAVRVIPTNEERMIARAVAETLAQPS